MMLQFFTTLFGGALFVLGVIAGIGPQNLNTMTHAIRRNHEYAVATTCFLADIALILLGCLGLKFTESKIFLLLINLIGIGFLSYYLWLKIKGLNKPHEVKFSQDILDKKSAILRALALTWLNPLVAIDTLVIIGGASTNYHGIMNFAFIAGAILGDFIWLFGLTLISRTFAERLNRPLVWLFIDISTILLVAYILIRMVSFLFT
ncbi:MAG: hypothetical protein E6Q33_09910 [Neisseriales bacterium]|nr:MAG: hypothetical protein E6Q33_09910 [Neisseriales bacterium]